MAWVPQSIGFYHREPIARQPGNLSLGLLGPIDCLNFLCSPHEKAGNTANFQADPSHTQAHAVSECEVDRGCDPTVYGQNPKLRGEDSVVESSRNTL
jgi:hypothetical protein